MSVHRAEIGKAHIFKDRTVRINGLLDQGLDTVVHLIDLVLLHIIAKETAIPLFKSIVAPLGAKLFQMLGNAAHVAADGHAVVIEQDDDRFTGLSRIVETLVGKTACQRAVADQGKNTVILPLHGA